MRQCLLRPIVRDYAPIGAVKGIKSARGERARGLSMHLETTCTKQASAAIETEESQGERANTPHGDQVLSRDAGHLCTAPMAKYASPTLAGCRTKPQLALDRLSLLCFRPSRPRFEHSGTLQSRLETRCQAVAEAAKLLMLLLQNLCLGEMVTVRKQQHAMHSPQQQRSHTGGRALAHPMEKSRASGLSIR